MKKFVVILAVLGLICILSFDSFAKDLKIGYVDILKVFNDYGKTKKYDKMLEEKKQEKEGKLEVKRKEIEKLQSKLSLLKDEKQKVQQEKIAAAVKDYRELEQRIFDELKKERNRKMQEIVDDINKIIKDYAKKEKFDLVINENSVLYGTKAMDITKEILKNVNRKKKK